MKLKEKGLANREYENLADLAKKDQNAELYAEQVRNLLAAGAQQDELNANITLFLFFMPRGGNLDKLSIRIERRFHVAISFTALTIRPG